MHIDVPDPDIGRCKNYRDGERCLDYDGTQHVCTFPEKPKREEVAYKSSFIGVYAAPRPKPWVKP